MLARPEPEARKEILQKAAWLPVRDPHRLLFRRLLVAVDAPTVAESRLAFSAVMARANPDEVPDILARISSLAFRRPLVVGWLSVLPTWAHARAPHRSRQLALGVLELLGADALLVVPYLTLAGHVLDGAAMAERLVELSARGRLDCDAIDAARGAFAKLRDVRSVELALAAAPDPLLRRLALHALIAGRADEGWGWNDRSRASLARSDPIPTRSCERPRS